MSAYIIDEIDRKIINMLTENARVPFLEVARGCGISGAAIHQRVHKLEEAGVFKGSRYIINQQVIGYSTCAFVGVHFEKGSVYSDVMAQLQDVPEVIESHYTTGNYSLFLKIYARDNQHMMEILNHTIQQIPGVASTETFISLEQAIDRQVSL